MTDIMREADLRPEPSGKHRANVPYTVATPYPSGFQPRHAA